MDNISEVLKSVNVSDWIYNVNEYRTKSFTYWIHKTSDSKGSWLFTNFNFNLTNLDLKTDDLLTAEKRAIIILKTKMNYLDNFISNLTKFTKKIRTNTIKLTPEFTKKVENFMNSTGFM